MANERPACDEPLLVRVLRSVHTPARPSRDLEKQTGAILSERRREGEQSEERGGGAKQEDAETPRLQREEIKRTGGGGRELCVN